MEQSKVMKIYSIIQRLRRSYPDWPSTFTTCKCGRGSGRGCDNCAHCIEEELANYVGNDKAKEFHDKLKVLRGITCELMDIGRKDDE